MYPYAHNHAVISSPFQTMFIEMVCCMKFNFVLIASGRFLFDNCHKATAPMTEQ